VSIAPLLHQVGHRGLPAAAGLVDHMHAYRQELFLLHCVGHEARQHVGAAARARVDHHLDRLAGLEGLRADRQGDSRGNERGDENP